MKKATQKEFETIQEVFSLNYVKVLFKQLLKEGLLTKGEYLSISSLIIFSFHIIIYCL